MDRPKLLPLADAERIYARPGGEHYHLDRDCPMLSADFDRFGYVEINRYDVKARRLRPCACAYKRTVKEETYAESTKQADG